MNNRVVITGMGITSSIGTGIDTFWANAIQGKSGIRQISRYDASLYPTQIAGETIDFDIANLPLLEKPKRYPLVAQYALLCAHEALLQSGLSESERRLAGTFIGTSLGGTPELEASYKTFYEESWKRIPPLTVLRGMPNAIANHIAIHFGLCGQNATFSNACVSSADAIHHAFQQIQHGILPIAVAGGTESLIFEALMSAWCKLRVMSTRNETPETACRPFDATRDGLIMADGAGVIVLESLEHAKARGAKIYAEILGIGTSCDAFHMTAPTSEGQVRAVNNALNAAKIAPTDVHYINAHGTSTELNDITETNTIKAVFGESASDIPVTAQKSMTGHAIGAAGVMEIIATSLSLHHGILLPTINLHEADPKCDLDYVPNQARKKDIHIALSNHFAFGGANVGIVLGRAD